MPDVLKLGSFILKTQWLLIALAVLGAYIVIRLRLKFSTYPFHPISDTLENSLVLVLVFWKFSLLLFSPTSVIANPLALLYFSGGMPGLWLGIAAAASYVYYRGKKDNISLWVYTDLYVLGNLSGVIMLHLGSWVMGKTITATAASQAFIFLVIILAVFRKTKLNQNPYYLIQVILWISLAQVFSAFLDPLKQNDLWGFSKVQLVFMFLAVISLIVEMFLDKKTLKSWHSKSKG